MADEERLRRVAYLAAQDAIRDARVCDLEYALAHAPATAAAAAARVEAVLPPDAAKYHALGALQGIAGYDFGKEYAAGTARMQIDRYRCRQSHLALTDAVGATQPGTRGRLVVDAQPPAEQCTSAAPSAANGFMRRLLWWR